MEEPIFQNDQLQPDWLPKVDEIQFTPLPDRYRTVLLISTSVFYIILLIVLIALWLYLEEFTSKEAKWFLLGWAALFLFSITRIVLTFPYKGYAVRQRDIVYKKGWLWRSVTTVPFNRVQHCDIKEGIIERNFNLSRLNVYTAGGQSSDLKIPGLPPEISEKYKNYILQTIADDEEE